MIYVPRHKVFQKFCDLIVDITLRTCATLPSEPTIFEAAFATSSLLESVEKADRLPAIALTVADACF